MKVYIMTDLEGVSGACHEEYMDRQTPYFRDACRYLMGDVNAAIAGAFDGGATEVYARDGHDFNNNFIQDMLDPRAIHEVQIGDWYSRLDGSFDATFSVGAHAMAGVRDGFLSHTQCPRKIFEFRVNGRALGEMGQWALGCGHYGIPLVMVAGDEAACAEAREFFPGIPTVAVKRGVSWSRALTYPVSEVQEKIRDAAATALRNLKSFKPLKVKKPLVCEQVYTSPKWADEAARNENFQRVDGRTCRKIARNQLDCVM